MMKHDAMENVHPIVAFTFLAFALVMPMLFMHPVFIIVSFVSGLIWALMIRGRMALAFIFKFVIPIILIVAIINPIFNHEGVTILFYIRDNPITLESIFYGATSALMFGAVLIWFSCFNDIMKSDKIVYLFGNFIPSISLLITMVLRFVPLYRNQVKKISVAMRAQGFDVSDGNLLKRAKYGLNILSSLITWGLESSVITADSMRSRGHGLPHRTNYSIYNFDSRDLKISIVLILGIVFIGICAATKAVSASFFPLIKLNSWNTMSIACALTYAVILIIPIILNIEEIAVWQRLKSKI